MINKIVIIGAGVCGLGTVTKLINRGYPGELITIIDKGQDPYNRPDDEVMLGFAGAGLKSDGKYSYLSNTVGGHLTKYCGEEKAQKLIDEGLEIIKSFHPEPDKVMYSAPIEEPEFIKPHFSLRLSPTHHIGTDYLDVIGKTWFDWLVSKGVYFLWKTEVQDIQFKEQIIICNTPDLGINGIKFDKLIYNTGKSGIDLTQYLINKYNLKKEPKSVQLGVRFSAPQKYFQKILDIAYDFKLYQKKNDQVSLRSFCTNSTCAYVAEETTYGMKSYNGHSYKDREPTNMVNFGIIMEIKGIDNPFQFQKDVVSKCQFEGGMGIHFSPNFTRKPSLTAEGKEMNLVSLGTLGLFTEAYGEYAQHIIEYIEDLNNVFQFGEDYSLYIPEVKFLSEEVLVDYSNLSLIDYPNIYFGGDALSARGIAVSFSHGIYVAESILKNIN